MEDGGDYRHNPDLIKKAFLSKICFYFSSIFNQIRPFQIDSTTTLLLLLGKIREYQTSEVLQETGEKEIYSELCPTIQAEDQEEGKSWSDQQHHQNHHCQYNHHQHKSRGFHSTTNWSVFSVILSVSDSLVTKYYIILIDQYSLQSVIIFASVLAILCQV